MKRSEQEFPINNLLFCGTIRAFWQLGVFDEYSDDHFLIRAIYNDNEYFKNVFIRRHLDLRRLTEFGFNFIINLDTRIRSLVMKFGEDKIIDFMTNQFSAGKHHYSEKMFFEALAEVHVLHHFTVFARYQTTDCIYEPILIEGSRHKPEARIKYENSIIADIEVKTPDFPKRDMLINSLYPAMLLTDVGRQKLSEYCTQHNISLKLPRVLKIKDFMNSASEKFQALSDKQHLNLLFINWTNTDVYEDPLFEPTVLFCNEANGIFMKKEVGVSLGIDNNAYEKISAVIIYTIPEDALLFGDLRYLFRDRCYKIIINPFARYTSAELLHDLTGMAVHYPEKLSGNLTTYYNLENKDWSREINEIRDIIDENILFAD